MKATYRSKRTPPPYEASRYWTGGFHLATYVISPRTGKRYGLVIREDHGKAVVEGPSFCFPTVRKLMDAADTLPDLMNGDLPKMGDMINDRFLGK